MTTVSLAAKPDLSAATIGALHQHFLQILPRIQTHAEIQFRYLRCPGKREDAIAEVIALAWSWFCRVIEQGKNPDEFVTALADFAVRHVRSGRRLCGQEKAKDVLSSRAQRRKGFKVESLPNSTRRHLEVLHSNPHGQDSIDAFEERLRDNTVTPPDEQAAFRIDYPQWLSQLGERNLRIAQDMATEQTTMELAQKHQVSPGRISQIRREFHQDWQRFHGEVV